MFDARLRRRLAPALDRAAGALERRGARAGTVTAVGWLVGLGAVGAALGRLWPLALLAWWANRALDGLDGALARRRGASELGGYLDLVADFSIYAGLALAVAVVEPAARLATVALLVAYYLSGTALLGGSAILERHGVAHDERSVNLLGGLAEGAETILAYTVVLAWPAGATTVAWTFAALVSVTAVQRVARVARTLRPPAVEGRPVRRRSGTQPG
jgi:phosphatidylglycerophosphate synthase